MNWMPLTESHRLPAICGVYLIRHRESSKEYVGKSVNVRVRSMYHRRANTGVTYLYKSIRKYGVDAFDICLFATGTEAEMTALEIEVIAARGTFNPAGYNQTRGGDGTSGYRATPEHRAAISARVKGVPLADETKRKMRETALARNPFRGKKHRPETIEKMREASRLQGTRPRTPAQLGALAAMSEGRRGSTHTDETKAKISQRLKGRKKPEGFGVGLHTGEKNAMYGKKGAKHPRARLVLVWLPESMTPLSFDTVNDAAEWAGCKPASISDWCCGRYRPKNGFVWCSI